MSDKPKSRKSAAQKRWEAANPEAAKAVNAFIAQTDWDEFWRRVIAKASPKIEAYRVARARSLALAVNQVFL